MVSLRWSAAGRRFFFNINTNGLLYSVNTDGSGMSLLAERIYGFDLSPDGQQLVASHIGTATLLVDIITMNIDGKRRNTLIDDATRASLGLGSDSSIYGPAWSPDGTRIAFYTNTGNGICVIHPDGSAPLAYTAGAYRIAGGYMDWSPDNRHLAFHQERPSSIGSLDVTTGETNEIPQDHGWAWHPSWSPDGRRIVFEWTIAGQGEGQESQIWVINADGSGLTQLTFEGKNCCPVWLP